MKPLSKYFLLTRRSLAWRVKWLWQVLSPSIRSKKIIKHRLFRNFPFIFRHFKSYSDWLRQNPPINHFSFDNQNEEPGNLNKELSRRIVFVSQNAQPYGSQFLALGIIKKLKQELDVDVEVLLLLGGGPLKNDFEALAPVYELNELDAKVSDMKMIARSFVRRGFTRAIVNTTVSGKIVPIFHDAGIACLCLIHELPGIIRSHKLEKRARQIASSAKAIVFPAQIVADSFAQFAHVDIAKQVIQPQGLFRKNEWRSNKNAARAELRKRLGLSEDAKVVLTVGHADYRKGTDLFVECAFEILKNKADVDFVWVGHGSGDPALLSKLEEKIIVSAYRKKIHFVGYDPDTALYQAGSDVYALTSREDPFPNVVLESLDVGVPVVAFSATGGAAKLLEKVGGIVVPFEDVSAYAAAICQLLESQDYSTRLGDAGQEYVDQHLGFREYLIALCGLLEVKLS